MGSRVTLSHLALSDLERSKSRSLRFRGIIYRNGPALGMLQLDINRKAYLGSLYDVFTFYLNVLERSMSNSLRFSRPIFHEFLI